MLDQFSDNLHIYLIIDPSLFSLRILKINLSILDFRENPRLIHTTPLLDLNRNEKLQKDKIQ